MPRWSRGGQEAQGQPQAQGRKEEHRWIGNGSPVHHCDDPPGIDCNVCVNSRHLSTTTAVAPAHDPHLDPRVIILTDQGAPRISLEKEKETNCKTGRAPRSEQTGCTARRSSGGDCTAGLPQAPTRPRSCACEN